MLSQIKVARLSFDFSPDYLTEYRIRHFGQFWFQFSVSMSIKRIEINVKSKVTEKGI